MLKFNGRVVTPVAFGMYFTQDVGLQCHSTALRHHVIRVASFIYLGFYVAFNTAQVISRRVVGRAEETSTYSSLGLCTVNCRPTASNYQLSHLRP